MLRAERQAAVGQVDFDRYDDAANRRTVRPGPDGAETGAVVCCNIRPPPHDVPYAAADAARAGRGASVEQDGQLDLDARAVLLVHPHVRNAPRTAALICCVCSRRRKRPVRFFSHHVSGTSAQAMMLSENGSEMSRSSRPRFSGSPAASPQ
jgi:hypothetical protein